MEADTYKVIQMAVEDGVAIGVRRAFKHNERPDHDRIIEVVRQEVMNQICEWFKFEADKQ